MKRETIRSATFQKQWESYAAHSSIYGPNGERIHLTVDRIEKIVKKAKASSKNWTGSHNIALNKSLLRVAV